MLICLLVPVGCKNQGFENENDKLRAERSDLQDALKELQNKLALREGELVAIREQIDEQAEPIEGIEPPRLAGIVLGMYSGAIDSDGDMKNDALRVYVRPVDQHGRQMTAIGPARVRLLTLPAEGEPKTFLDQTFSAEQFHKAYRSGVTGTHYTLKAPLPDPLPTTAKLFVTLTDATTGRSYAAEKEVELVRGGGGVE